jgi:NAD+ kinase
MRVDQSISSHLIRREAKPFYLTARRKIFCIGGEVNKRFNTIGIIGRQRTTIEMLEILQKLVYFLSEQHYDIVLEKETAASLTAVNCKYEIAPKAQLGALADLVIVIGGDGSLLNAAHIVVNHGKPVLGINRGRLGFLTDIHPDKMSEKIGAVLQGEYLEEKRFLLTGNILHGDKVIYTSVALNDIVLLPGHDSSHMIEFEIHINKQLVCSQRADGQIIATPTGSTAYALSGGGPILHPALNAIVLVPMFSHTLSNRPIVVDGNSYIEIHIHPSNENSAMISYDGGSRIAIAPGDSLCIERKPEQLILLHPKDYNYYETLRTKLHWQKKL